MEVARVKYNNYRREHFQTATVILEAPGRRHVVKRGLSRESAPHIKSLQGKFEALHASHRRFYVIPPVIVNAEAHFEFDKGTSLLAKLCNLMRIGDLEGFELELMKFAGAVGDAARPTSAWWRSEGFVQIFGEIPPKFQRSTLCLSPANIDMVFSNVHVRNDEDVPYAMFDYEWTFDFPVPLEYVLWRALSRFSKTLNATTHQRWTNERLCRTVGVDVESFPLFEAMERRFQNYVYGDQEFQNTPEDVNHQVPILDFEKLATWVASSPERAMRQPRKQRYAFLKRVLGPALPYARRIRKRLSGR